jgi:hypothetical protein
MLNIRDVSYSKFGTKFYQYLIRLIALHLYLIVAMQTDIQFIKIGFKYLSNI